MIIIKMPILSPTMKKGRIDKWFYKIGDKVEEGDLLCLVATDKSVVEHNAPEAGFLRKLLVDEGSDASVGEDIAIFTEGADDDISSYLKESEEKVVIKQSQDKKEVAESRALSLSQIEPFPPKKFSSWKRVSISGRASPLAKKVAKERSLDISSVSGSGPGGRVMLRDLERCHKKSILPSGEPELPPGAFHREDLTPMRDAISKKLVDVNNSLPSFTISSDIVADNLIDIRSQLKREGINLTFNDFIVRGVALALRDHPIINSGFDSKRNQIIMFDTIDISIVIDVGNGLITPIIYHADYKKIFEISEEVKILVKSAKEDKLTPEDYQGGSFTISNLGMFKIDSFSSIISAPQAAILAVGGIIPKPLVKEGSLVPGNVVSLTLTVDHRVIDGAEGAKFLMKIKNLIENPTILIV